MNTNQNVTSGQSNISLGNFVVNSTVSWDQHGAPYLIDTIVNPDSIELVYRRDSQVILTSNPPQTPPPQIYKEVYKAVGNMLAIVNRVYGRYVPAQKESYEFD